MKSPKITNIPVVNITKFIQGDKSERNLVANQIGDALRDVGFFAMEGHGVSGRTMKNAYGLAMRFFSMQKDKKAKYTVPGCSGQRGFTGFGTEHAKDSSAPDLKEFYHIGHEIPPGNSLSGLYPQNVWPSEVPRFKESLMSLFWQLNAASMHVLDACSIYLGEDENFLRAGCQDGDSILRLLNYLITRLCEATAPGLEILTRDGDWLAVKAEPGQIIVDSADMLQNLSNGYLRSTTHRVVNPDNSRESRFSMPFFVTPRPDFDLTPRATSVAKSGGSVKHQSVKTDAFVAERLKKIGLAK